MLSRITMGVLGYRLQGAIHVEAFEGFEGAMLLTLKTEKRVRNKTIQEATRI